MCYKSEKKSIIAQCHESKFSLSECTYHCFECTNEIGFLLHVTIFIPVPAVNLNGKKNLTTN